MADAANGGNADMSGSQDLPFDPRGVSPVTTLTQHFLRPTRSPFQHASAVHIPPLGPFQGYYAPYNPYPQHIVTGGGSAIPYMKSPPFLVHESVIQSTSSEQPRIPHVINDGPSPAKKIMNNFDLKHEAAYSTSSISTSELPVSQHNFDRGPKEQLSATPHFSFSNSPVFTQQELKKEKDLDEDQYEQKSCLSLNNTRKTSVLMSASSLPSPIPSPAVRNGSPSIDMKNQIDITQDVEPVLCVICSDKATGHHYGVTSCEGCKGFFKRTVQNKKNYTCRNLSKDCPIDKRHRNRCQYCRYQKCISAGMLKDAVREDRTPGGKHKNVNVLKIKIPSPELITDIPEIAPWNSPLIEELQKIDRSNVIPVLGENPEADFTTMNQLMQLASWQVDDVLKWFETIEFLKEIDHMDKTVLVRNSLMELLALGIAWRSASLQDRLLLGQGVYLDCSQAEEANIGDITQRIIQLAIKVNELKLDAAEYVCLTIIVLLNPDIKGLNDQKNVENLQDTVHTTMQGYITHRYPDQPNRFGNVLLRLPELRSISTKIMERLFFLNLTSNLSVSSPLKEFLYHSK